MASEPRPVRVAVFGGSFDPPHIAHQRAAQLVAKLPEVDRVLVVPVFEHAFDKSLAAFDHRVRMCELCMRDGANVIVSPVEATLERPNFTLNTLRALKRSHPEYELRLVVGADVLRDAERWHRFDEIQKLAPLLPLGRVGVSTEQAPAPVLPDISSTKIRQLLFGRPSARVPEAARERLQHWLPPEVLDYIEKQDLYR